MALFRRVAKASCIKEWLHFSKNFPASYTAVRHAGYLNRDWRPGPFPKTEKERKAAAKKYNLIPEDYEPYPDDGMGYGDYPKLPLKSMETKDPFVNWDIPHLRRHYGEPMHVDADILTEDKWTPDAKKYMSNTKMILIYLGVCGSIILFLYASPIDGKIRDLKPKQIWSPGAVHYTFDLEGSDDHHH